MTQPHIEAGQRRDIGDIAAKQEFLKKLGRYLIVKMDESTIGIIDPDDLIDGEEPRLLASFDLTEGRKLDDFFSILVGPALFLAGSNRDFLVGNAEKLAHLGEE